MGATILQDNDAYNQTQSNANIQATTRNFGTLCDLMSAINIDGILVNLENHSDMPTLILKDL
jgi:hypothetical protein